MALKTVSQSHSPILQAGKFRHRIQIVKPSSAQDSTGGWSVNVDNVVLTTWATIEALSGQEKFAAHVYVSSVSHAVYIRHPRSRVAGGITANMQVWFNKRQFQIEAVLNADERNKVLMLLCIELSDSSQQASGSPAESSI